MRSTLPWLFVTLLVVACGGSDTRPSRDTHSDDDAGSLPPFGHDAGLLDAAREAADAATSNPPRRTDGALPQQNDAAVDGATRPSDEAGPRTYATDRGQFFGAPRCSMGSFLLCEDFEGVASGSKANPAIWETMDDRILVDDTRAARGKQALHVVTKSLESVHFIRTTKIVPAAKNKMWGRLFFWVQPPRPTAFNHWSVIEATGLHPAGGTARMRFGGIDFSATDNQLDFNYDIWGKQPPNFKETGGNTGHDLADATWHCLEWMYDVPGRAVHLYRDGSEEKSLAFSGMVDGIALDFPAIDGLNIGMAIYQDIGTSSWSVYIDEVAVDTQRIGCSN